MFKDVADKPLHEVLGLSKRIADVGIELEVEGVHLPSPVPHWSSKQEGSLQNGIEYITKPIKFDIIETYVNNLRNFITESGGTVTPSYRCSTHIHVNFLPHKVADLFGMMVLFTTFEPLLLTLCGHQRNGNLFCMSSYDTGEIVPSFGKLCQCFEFLSRNGWDFQRGKYASLNTERLVDLGTLEARCFPLSVKGSKVKEWAGWLLKLRDMAINEPDKTFRSLWKTIRQNRIYFAVEIFGQQAMSAPNLDYLLESGTETGYELTRVLKQYYNKPEKSQTVRKQRLSKSDENNDGGW